MIRKSSRPRKSDLRSSDTDTGTEKPGGLDPPPPPGGHVVRSYRFAGTTDFRGRVTRKMIQHGPDSLVPATFFQHLPPGPCSTKIWPRTKHGPRERAVAPAPPPPPERFPGRNAGEGLGKWRGRRRARQEASPLLVCHFFPSHTCISPQICRHDSSNDEMSWTVAARWDGARQRDESLGAIRPYRDSQTDQMPPAHIHLDTAS